MVAAEHLEVTDDELRERITEDAKVLGRDPAQLVLDVHKSGRQEVLRDEMLMAKAVDFIAENAVAVPAPETDEAPAPDVEQASGNENATAGEQSSD